MKTLLAIEAFLIALNEHADLIEGFLNSRNKEMLRARIEEIIHSSIRLSYIALEVKRILKAIN
jgi:hypothetical protein